MIEVLYQDNHLLAANKPAGIPSQSTPDREGFDAQCRRWLKETTGKPGNVFLHATHRLDTPVSGIILFAKTSKALSRIQQMIREFKLEKYYLAIVEGSPLPIEGELIHYLGHDERAHKAFVTTPSKGKLAKLTYRTLNTDNELTLLEIHLITGRYHQIRAQLSAHKQPIIGDKKYESTHPFVNGEAIALHHARLLLPHPITQEILTVKAPLPPYWHLRD